MISIIIPSYNQGNYLEETIKSVLAQTNVDFEIIIIDGGSTDSTLAILQKYDDRIIWKSEQDHGQADALNKGLKLAKGEIIGWLNSDDLYEKNIFSEVNNIFLDSSVDWAIGITTYFLPNGKKYVDKHHIINYGTLIKNPDIVKQQGAFYRKSILEKIGGWNKKFFMAMDYDLWIRLTKLTSPVMINKNWAYYRIHENQKSAGKFILTQSYEILNIWKNENINLLNRVKFLIKRLLLFLKNKIKSILFKLNFIKLEYKSVPYSLKKSFK